MIFFEVILCNRISIIRYPYYAIFTNILHRCVILYTFYFCESTIILSIMVVFRIIDVIQ